MKPAILIMLISILILSCQTKKSNTEQIMINKSLKKNSIQEQKDSIERENHYGYDTLLLNKYVTDNGHEIQEYGSQSRYLYRVSTNSKKGIQRDFDITKNSYIANHSSILWDNENFLFIRYGCGTPCWAGLILSLNNNDEIKDFQMYLYEDSLNNLIVYPEKGWKHITLENFLTGEKSTEKIELCEKNAFPFYAIDTIINKSFKSVEIQYNAKGCEVTKKKVIKLKN